MAFTIAQVKEHLTAMGHSGTLNKVRYFEAACERAANTMQSKVKLVEQQRLATLSQTVHDKLFDYSLPSDYNGIIDLYPQGDRTNLDNAQRIVARPFDLLKAFRDKKISIEGSEGSKKIRIDWRIRSAKVVHTMDSYDGNGTWTPYGDASDISTDTIIKYSGNGSVKFKVNEAGASFDAYIDILNMSSVDLTDEDEIGDFIIPIYLSSVPANFYMNFLWGNTLFNDGCWSSAYITTQADGSAFKVGWNIVRVPWSTADEATPNTVDPSDIKAFRVNLYGDGPVTNMIVRVDNILCSIGYPFEIKYYTKYMFKSSAGTYESRPSTDDSTVLCDNDSLQIFLLELLKAIAHQLEGTDSVFDISFADKELFVLYQAYKGEHPDESKKASNSYSGLPRFKR